MKNIISLIAAISLMTAPLIAREGIAEVRAPKAQMEQQNSAYSMIVVKDREVPKENVVVLDENFDTFPPTGWSVEGGENWMSGTGAYAGGTAPEAKFNWQPGNSSTDQFLISSPINTSDAGSVNISFKHMHNNYEPGGYEIKLVASTDKTNWSLVHQFESNQTTPADLYEGELPEDMLGQTEVYLAWQFTGNTYGINYWFIDDVIVDKEISSTSNNLPISEAFDTFPPEGWSTEGGENWISGASNVAGGTAPEAKFNWQPGNSSTDQYLITFPFSTSNMSSVEISFKHMHNNYSSGGYEINLVASTDKTNWELVNQFTSNQTTPADIYEGELPASMLGQPQVYVAWQFTGSTYNLNSWHIDDVVIEEGSGTTPDTQAPEFLSLDGNEVNVGNDMNLTLVVSDETGVAATIEAKYNLTGVEETIEMTLSKENFTYTGTIESPEQAGNCDIVFYLEDSVVPANTAEVTKQISFIPNPDTEAPEFVSLDGNEVVVGNDMNLSLVVSDETGVPSTIEATFNLTGSEETIQMSLSKDNFTYTGTIQSPATEASSPITFHLEDTVVPANTVDITKQITFVPVPDTEAPEFVSLDGNVAVVGTDMNLSLVVSDDTGVPSTIQATYYLSGSEEQLTMSLNKENFTYSGTISSPDQPMTRNITFHLEDTVVPANTAEVTKQIEFVLPADTDAPEFVSLDGNEVVVGTDMNLTLVVSDETGVPSTIEATYNLTGSDETIELTLSKNSVSFKESKSSKSNFTYTGLISSPDEAASCDITFYLEDTVVPANTDEVIKQITFTGTEPVLPPTDVAIDYTTGPSATLSWVSPYGGSGTATEIVEDFEGDTFPPAGWTIVDNDGDSYNWGRLVHDAANGTAGAMSASWDETGGTLAPDNFLITKEVTIGDDYQISWFVRPMGNSSYCQDKYSVFISNSPEPSSFTDEIFTETFETQFAQMEERSVSLADYVGQTVYFAFRHFDCTDKYQVLVDDIVVNSADKVAEYNSNINPSIVEGLAKGEVVESPFKSQLNTPRVVKTPAIPKNVTGFNIYDDGEFIETVAPNATSYIAEGLVDGQEYTFGVSTLTNDGESEIVYSETITANNNNPLLVWMGAIDAVNNSGLGLSGGGAWTLGMVFDLPSVGTSASFKTISYMCNDGTNPPINWRVLKMNNTTTWTDEELVASQTLTDNPIVGTEWNDVEVNHQNTLNGVVGLVLDFPSGAYFGRDETSDLGISYIYYQDEWTMLGNGVVGQFPGDWCLKAELEFADNVEEILPGSTTLSQNYPNPFNPATTINFFNNMSGKVELNVYNAKGEMVSTLINENSFAAGNHTIQFDASSLNSGVYFYTLKTPTKTLTKKMVLVK